MSQSAGLLQYSFLFVALVLFSAHGFAKESSKTPSEAEIEALYKRVQSYERLYVKFEQETYRALRKKTNTRNGEAVFEVPKKFRWSYETPSKEEFIFNGTDLYLYKASEAIVRRVVNSNAGAAEIEQIVKVVLDLKELRDLYTIKSIASTDHGTTVEMSPKGTSGELELVRVVINKDGRVTLVHMKYNTGNYSEVRFAEHQLKVPESKLDFTPPKGVRVVDLK